MKFRDLICLLLIIVFIIILFCDICVAYSSGWKKKEKEEYGGGLDRIQQIKKTHGLSEHDILHDLNGFCNEKYNSPCFNGIRDVEKIANSTDETSIKSAYVLIFNQTKFDHDLKPERIGSEQDVKNLRDTFGNFDNYYVPEPHINATSSKIEETLANLKNEFATKKYDGLFLFIMSHGDKGYFRTSDNKAIPISLIEEAVCIDELRELPKVVVIQTCRGANYGTPETYVTSNGPSSSLDINITNSEVNDKVSLINTENRKKFLLFHATLEDCVSFRDHETFFIKKCCAVIQDGCKKGKLSLKDWLHKVIDGVSQYRFRLEPGKKPNEIDIRLINEEEEKKGGVIVSQLPEVLYRFTSDFFLPRFSARISNERLKRPK